MEKIITKKTGLTRDIVDHYRHVKKILIPSTIEWIDDFAFNNCTELQAVLFEYGSKCKAIGRGCFSNCINLRSIIIPPSLEYIGIGAFRDCEQLIHVTLPRSVANIGAETFMGCSNLQECIFYNPDINTGSHVFTYCPNLREIYYRGNLYKTIYLNYTIAIIQSERQYKGKQLQKAKFCDCFKDGVLQGDTVFVVKNTDKDIMAWYRDIHTAYEDCCMLEKRDILSKELQGLNKDSYINVRQYCILTGACINGSEEFLREQGIPIDATMKVEDVYKMAACTGTADALLEFIDNKEDMQ